MGRFVTLIVFIALLVGGVIFYWKYYYTYSDGNRSGLLQKFSHKGNVFKTYEGELVLNSLMANGVGPLSAEKFYFSVADGNVAQKLMAAEGHRITIHYMQKNGSLPWRGETEYIVDSLVQVSP